MKKSMRILLLLTAAFWPAAGFTADDEVKAIKKLDEVVVTATRTEEKLMDIPVNLQIITRDQIEESGITDIGDLMGKYVTGHLHRYSGTLTAVGLRGFKTDSHGDDIKGHVLILVDGHRVGTGNMAKLDIHNVERIEVIKGPASSLYGAAGVGGVVNIITRKGAKEFRATAKQELGSFSFIRSSASVEGTIAEKVGFFLSGVYQDQQEYQTPRYGTVYNTWDTRKNIGGNFTYFFNDNHDLRLGGNFADISGGSPSWLNGNYTSYDPDETDNYDKSHQNYDLEYNGLFLDGRLHWRSLGYYLWDKNKWYTGLKSNDVFTEYIDETLGTDQQLTIDLIPYNKLVLGVTYDFLEKEGEQVAAGGVQTAPYTPNMEYTTYSAYAQDSIDLLDNRLNIVVGARYDKFEVMTKKPTNVTINITEREVDFDHVSPKIGASYKLFDNFLRVRANIGQGFKPPSADQLSAQYERASWWGTQRYLGNPDLEPETATTYEGGFDISNEWIDFGVTYFYTDYEDKIQTAAKQVTFQGKQWTTWENLGESHIQGFDFSLDWRISRMMNWEPQLSLYSNLTFNTEKRDEENDTELQYISDYEIKSGLRFHHHQTSATLSHVLIGPQDITAWNGMIFLGVQEKESFDFWDFTFKQGFLDNWQAEIKILNLFNDFYEWVYAYPMPERQLRFGISWTF